MKAWDSAVGWFRRTAEDASSQFGQVPLSQRLAHALERLGIGYWIEITSAILTLVSVGLYIGETYVDQQQGIENRLRGLDLGLGCYFALEWLLWLYVSQHRMRFILSAHSAIDVVSTVPLLISYGVNVKLLFFQVLRFARIIRVFRLFRLGRRLNSSTLNTFFVLAMTLFSLLFIGAGFFYEIERSYGTRYPNLTFNQALYWAAVTLTTVGYGDYAPSVFGSQMMLVLLLLITVTLLPYQTNKVLEVLGQTNKYQRASYNPARNGRHVVIFGDMDGHSCEGLIDELLHADYGVQDYNLVFLGPRPPDQYLKRLLTVHNKSASLLYVQGSPMLAKDLDRVAVSHADALFIMADKHAREPREEDRKNTLTLMAVAQHLQQRDVYGITAAQINGDKVGGGGGGSKLYQLPKRRRAQWMGWKAGGLWSLLSLFEPPGGPPRLYVQLLLPESVKRLEQLLISMACPKHVVESVHAPPSTPTRRATGRARTRSTTMDEHDCAASALSESAVELADVEFWQRFAREISITCVNEIKQALLGYSTLACPGLIALVHGLLQTHDDSDIKDKQFEQLPSWLQQHLHGSSKEVYEVQAFPPHLHGRSFSQVALYLFTVHDAVLIALGSLGDVSRAALRVAPVDELIEEGTVGYLIAEDIRTALAVQSDDEDDFRDWLEPTSSVLVSSDGGPPVRKDAPPSFIIDFSRPATSCPAPPREPASKVQLPPLNVDQRTGNTWPAENGGAPAVSASDGNGGGGGGDAAVHSASQQQRQQQYQHQQRRQPQQHQQQPQRQRQQHHHHRQQQQQQQQQQQEEEKEEAATGPSRGSQPRGTASARNLEQAMGGTEQMSGRGLLQPNDSADDSSAALVGGGSSGDEVLPHAGSEDQIADADAAASQASGPVPTADDVPFLAPPLDTPFTEPVAGEPVAPKTGSSAVGGERRSRKTLGAVGTLAHAHAKLSRHSIMYHLRKTSEPNLAVIHHRPGGRAVAGGAIAMASTRKARDLANRFLRSHYHMRTGSIHLRDIMCEDVEVSGHILICCSGISPEDLYGILACLRSKRLQRWSQVVILNERPPAPDAVPPLWNEIARFSDVRMVQGSVHSSYDLARVHAEQASAAILMPSLNLATAAAKHISSHIAEQGIHIDGRLLFAIEQLQQLNPDIEVVTEMLVPEHMGLLSSHHLHSSIPAELAPYTSSLFTSGSVYLSAIADLMLCQALYNHVSDRLIAKLLTEWHYGSGGNINASIRHADEAAAATTASTDNPAAPSSSSPTADQGHDAATGPGSMILQLEVQDQYDCYGSLFRHLLSNRGMVCIGLYRIAHVRVRHMRYVYTCPRPTDRLQPGDRAFVLCDLAVCGGRVPPDAYRFHAGSCRNATVSSEGVAVAEEASPSGN